MSQSSMGRGLPVLWADGFAAEDEAAARVTRSRRFGETGRLGSAWVWEERAG